MAMLPLGFPMEISEAPVDILEEKERIRNIDVAVAEASTKFATEVRERNALLSD
jgi:hypothetical protein